ncbi:poly alpha-glucosyltransferase [Acinetobacter sp. AOR15_HL]|uniref:poly alpha-glucosyltransferase n=1 Tax=unclassified Acinetobacter TaxID=196816 RepID=UPI0022EB5184|nr:MULTISPECIES: poly alpha-glucosyltransferase [unclassified Acinetobacter]MDA3555939.1 poly alpha-glucosyltransferase [Acinetobacter sp. AOR15_HL]MDA3570298.1 poly alpha-glucosyltransferase [Acinetobacter sp. AOR14_HL]
MTAFLNFQRQLNLWLEQVVQHVPSLKQDIILFLSYGPKDQRCSVWHSEKTNLEQAKKQLLDFINDQFAQAPLADYIKIDIAYNLAKQAWKEVEQQVHHQFHNNHYRKGIGFDEQSSVAFLEQEIYGKAIIRGLSYDKPNFFDETNLNYAIKQKYNATKPQIKLQELQEIWTFDTYAGFYENGQFINLASRYDVNGIRGISNNKKQHFQQLIEQNSAFLHDQIQENGKFIYGYFSAYDRDIRNYNTVRHCTSVYALLETFEVQNKPEYWSKIHAAIHYALTKFYKEKDSSTAFMIDGKEGELEIKLGANAAAILMLTKYQEITQKTDYQKYAEKLANGILKLVDLNGSTTHVLNYPDYDLKEKFRIIYYDGEAALALLRLYQINQDSRLLETVKLMFECFIEKRYEKYHDHWLSYCTNELTKICPEDKYFIFGLNNYLKHFIFIKNRKTTYATLLEMLMAAYKMVNRLKEQGRTALFEQSYMSELQKLIEFRADFQTTGFFYPEMAMYMARPDKILHAFYIRHDRFRVRIDDQEHNLSGYIAYVKDYKGDEQ